MRAKKTNRCFPNCIRIRYFYVSTVRGFYCTVRVPLLKPSLVKIMCFLKLQAAHEALLRCAMVGASRCTGPTEIGLIWMCRVTLMGSWFGINVAFNILLKVIGFTLLIIGDILSLKPGAVIPFKCQFNAIMDRIILLPPADNGLHLELVKKVKATAKHPTLVPVKVKNPNKRKAGPANLAAEAAVENSDFLPPAVDDDGETFLATASGADLQEYPGTKTGKPGPKAKKSAAVTDCRFADGHRWTPFSGCVCKIQHQYTGDAVMEVFCPPRLVAEAQARGLKAGISLDKDTGWNANLSSEKRHACALLQKHRPWLLLVSPECRMYSIMQRNCNQKKMDPKVWEEQLAEADDHVDFGMDLCIAQGKDQRKFVFEHPSGAASWKKETVQRVLEEVPGARIISFAQCRFGLQAPNGQPLQKLTKFLTNSKAVIQTFQGCQCVCESLGLTHAKIEGSMEGHRMSRWAQKYPPSLVSALMDCCQREMP